MILKELQFAILEPIHGASYDKRLLLTETQHRRLDALSRFCGHAYIEALGRYATPATWKIMYVGIPSHFGPIQIPPVVGSNKPGGPGVDEFNERIGIDEIGALCLARDDAAIAVVLERLHRGCVNVGSELGWDIGPFETAYQGALASPTVRRRREWKANRSRTCLARLTLDETLGQVRATIEFMVAGEIVSSTGFDLPYYYASGAWSDIRDIVWQGDEVVLRTVSGVEVFRLAAPAAS